MISFDWPWALWLGAIFVSFWALELRGLFGDPQKTLTYRLRAWLGISPRRPVRHAAMPLFIAGILALPIWLIAHLLS